MSASSLVAPWSALVSGTLPALSGQASPIAVFLVLTVTISVVCGLAAFAIGGEGTFENPRALPLLLVTIWSPNIAAVTVAAALGDLGGLTEHITRGASGTVWLVALTPLAVAAVVGRTAGPRTRDATVGLSPTLALALIGTNLVMGPLGEELGWRGFLLPRMLDAGLVVAALGVGVVWALWHLPLWYLPSPQRAIPYPVFFATVVCFSVVMTALWAAGDGALGPVVVFHLCANVGVGWLEVSERTDAAGAYRRSLPLHAGTALVAVVWLAMGTHAPLVA